MHVSIVEDAPRLRDAIRDRPPLGPTTTNTASVLVDSAGRVASAEGLLIRTSDEAALTCISVGITALAQCKRLGEPWIIATVPGIGYRIDTAPGTGREGGDRE